MIHTLNDSRHASITNRRVLRAALIVNSVLAAVTAVSALLALWRPELLLNGAPAGSGAALYAGAYAARAIPLGAAIAVLAGTRRLGPLEPLLLIGAAAQLGDLAVAAAIANPGMAFGSTLCAAGHLFGWFTIRAARRRA